MDFDAFELTLHILGYSLLQLSVEEKTVNNYVLQHKEGKTIDLLDISWAGNRWTVEHTSTGRECTFEDAIQLVIAY
jgi:hypothetical protein